MAPAQGSRAPLEFGGPLGNGTEWGDLGSEAPKGETGGVSYEQGWEGS